MNMRLQKLMAHHGLFREEADPDKGGGGGDSKPGDKPADKPDDKSSKPTDAEAKLLKEVMEKKTTIKDLESRLAQFDGIDPAKVKELIAKAAKDAADAAAAERKRLEDAGQFDAVKKQMLEAHAAETKSLTDKITELLTQNETASSQIKELTVGNAFGTSTLIREDLALTPAKVRVLYGAHFAYEDGKVVGYDKPAGAKNRAPLVDGKGEPLPFDEALRKIIDADPDKDSVLKSKVKPGAASGTANADAKKGNDEPGNLTGLQKIQAGLKDVKK